MTFKNFLENKTELLKRSAKLTLDTLMGLSVVNRWLILGMDLLITTFAYVFAMIIRLKVDELHPIPFVVEWGFMFLFFNAVAFYVLKPYRGLIRHSNLREMWRVLASLVFSCTALYLSWSVFEAEIMYPYFLVQTIFLISLVMMLCLRLLVSVAYFYSMTYSGRHSKKTLVYGVGSISVSLAQWINNSPTNKHQVQGFVVRSAGFRGTRINDLPVYDLDQDAFYHIIKRHEVTTLVFPDQRSAQQEEGLVAQCVKRGISVMVTPASSMMYTDQKMQFRMQPIQFEDLLGREEIHIDLMRIGSQLHGKVILITGAAGSIGSELVRQLSVFKPSKLILFDVAETPLHYLRLELEQTFPDLEFEPIIGDVRSPNRLNHVFRTHRPEVVYHAAAYKHVPLMEENPCEAVMVNVLGTRNLSNFAVQYGVERFVMVSTDKAVNPTNVMGASKRLAEIYVQSLALESQKQGKNIQFVTTRFGNVLGSNGSVIPRFKEQIERGGPVTVTHPDIIRYFMTIPEACRLVLQAASFGNSGEIYVFDMGDPVRIDDLARRMIEMAGFRPGVDIEIRYTGLRPGEKLYEELLNDQETTVQTDHKKIKVANVRRYAFREVNDDIQFIIDQAAQVNIQGTISAMKKMIPEFVSKNSPWEIYDVAGVEEASKIIHL